MTEQARLRDTALDAPIERLVSTADSGPKRPSTPGRREALDREEDLIRASVLRMGALVEAAIRQASRSLTSHDASPALRERSGRVWNTTT